MPSALRANLPHVRIRPTCARSVYRRKTSESFTSYGVTHSTRNFASSSYTTAPLHAPKRQPASGEKMPDYELAPKSGPTKLQPTWDSFLEKRQSKNVSANLRLNATPSTSSSSLNESLYDIIMPSSRQPKSSTKSEASIHGTAMERWAIKSAEEKAKMVEQKFPAGKYSGRSVQINARLSIGVAMGRLNRIMMQNNVKKELRLIERFEKPTDKRSRLASERHRRRFADMIVQKVQVVRDIRARGG